MAYESFESGSFDSEWTVESTMSVTDTKAFDGSFSAFGSGSYVDSNAQANWTPSDWNGGKQVDEFIFYYSETSNSYGGGIRFKNSNGNVECGAATDNPQYMSVNNNGNFNLISTPPDNYGNWIKVSFAFDWTNSEVQISFEDVTAGTSPKSITVSIEGQDVEEVELMAQTDGSWGGESYEMYYDGLEEYIPVSPTVDLESLYGTWMVNQELEFNVEASDPQGDVPTIDWDMGDGTTYSGTGTKQTHTYTNNGTYTVTVTATDSDGNTDTFTRDLSIVEPTSGNIFVEYLVGPSWDNSMSANFFTEQFAVPTFDFNVEASVHIENLFADAFDFTSPQSVYDQELVLFNRSDVWNGNWLYDNSYSTFLIPELFELVEIIPVDAEDGDKITNGIRLYSNNGLGTVGTIGENGHSNIYLYNTQQSEFTLVVEAEGGSRLIRKAYLEEPFLPKLLGQDEPVVVPFGDPKRPPGGMWAGAGTEFGEM